MQVYTSVTDHSYSTEYPGDRTTYGSIAAAKQWFRDYINDRIYRWNGYPADFPCGGSTEAVMNVYTDQYTDIPVAQFRVGGLRDGEYTVRVSN